jgi:endoglucanase
MGENAKTPWTATPYLRRMIARSCFVRFVLPSFVIAGSACGGSPSPAVRTPASSEAAGTSAASPAPAASTRPPLGRGMNLGDALDAPTEGEWGVVLQAEDFVAVKRAGFDHVRVPVRFNAHAAAAAPYTVDATFFARVDWAIQQALANRLAVIVDFHHYMELMTNPDENRDRFLGIWKQVAERYRTQPDSVYFELLNEPNGALVADKWNAIAADAMRIVRASNPTRAVVMEGVFWASAKNLRDTLVVPDGDPNVVGSFHMYQPILFTHQGASFMGPEYQTRGVVFPGPPPTPLTPVPGAASVQWVSHWFQRYNEASAETNPSGPRTIAEELEMAKVWADRHHLPVYLGEFGADDVADADSRARWTHMVRTAAEQRGFSWAYWDDSGSFKALDRATHTWVPYLKAALLE